MFQWLGSIVMGAVILFIVIALVSESDARELVALLHQMMDRAIEQIVYFKENILPEWAGVIRDTLRDLKKS